MMYVSPMLCYLILFNKQAAVEVEVEQSHTRYKKNNRQLSTRLYCTTVQPGEETQTQEE